MPERDGIHWLDLVIPAGDGRRNAGPFRNSDAAGIEQYLNALIVITQLHSCFRKRLDTPEFAQADDGA